MRLRAELLATGGTTTGFQVPDSFVDGLGGGGRPKVAVTAHGVTFRTSIARMGAEYADEGAAAFWGTLSFSAKRWHTEQVTGAKTAQTRARRVARSIELLREGRAR